MTSDKSIRHLTVEEIATKDIVYDNSGRIWKRIAGTSVFVCGISQLFPGELIEKFGPIRERLIR